MNQRVMIAMAIACNPRLLIADEPTTALDVTIQAQILDLLLDLQRERGMALLLITHDMGVVAETAQRVVVQYAGQQAEAQEVAGLFADPQHPYTAALLHALPERCADRILPTIPGIVPGAGDRPSGCLFHPRCEYATERCVASSRRFGAGPARQGALPLSADPRPPGEPPALCGGGGMSLPGPRIVQATDLERDYVVSRGLLRGSAVLQAVRGASFELYEGRTLAVVGESGCGKSTLARLVTLIEPPSAGRLEIDGIDVARASRERAQASAHDRADRVPGPVRLAQPAQEDRRDPGGAAQGQHRAWRRPSGSGWRAT